MGKVVFGILEAAGCMTKHSISVNLAFLSMQSEMPVTFDLPIIWDENMVERGYELVSCFSVVHSNCPQ